ncbi:FG-GAP repeat domain-containing protein [Desulfopila aestuarii]|uniref:Repeat domain-containing protein n=1 Tax=Desulfopila aestuarii DSM 18488 TaxID=1121416 RepID=A0A1M7YIQ5_9BACT|nr:VCBS repeat-containing protein [Desulfopila aestuarii]SHO52493.1 Repeat domain-containing protein [Desulfopila aestuarii DSM 18488]
MLSRIAAVIVLCLMITGVVPAIAAEKAELSRVMVLPFDGSSAGDFQYLTDSVRTMIASRLAAKQNIEVVEYALSATDLAALQGGEGAAAGETVFTRLNADYLISGSLYALQTGLKIQATLSRKTTTPGAREGGFAVLAENESQIISSVEELADDIASRGIGSRTAGALFADTQGSDREAISGFGTEHPEKIFKKGLYSGAIVAEGAMQVESLGVRKSSDLPLTLVSMATGDLDGDGIMEIVAASRTTLEIYRFDETVFKKLAEYKFDKSYKIHAVNIADLNGDGAPEIYLSANNKILASSAVFSWSVSNGLKPVLTDIRYYIRPVETPADGWILAGQRGSNDYTLGFVEKNIVKLVFDENTKGYVEDKVLPLPANLHLFDFVYAELDGKGGKELVAVDRNEKILVYDASNSLLWVSENDYGGSRNFIGPPKSAVTSVGDLFGKNDNKKIEQLVVFVPTRLLAVDVDKDGIDEIITGSNKRITPKWFASFREYDGGSVACLSWQETAMAELWKTNTVTGYLADYMYVPPRGEGGGKATSALYIAQVPDTQMLGFAYSSDSKVLKYEMNVSMK